MESTNIMGRCRAASMINNSNDAVLRYLLFIRLSRISRISPAVEKKKHSLAYGNFINVHFYQIQLGHICSRKADMSIIFITTPF
jgi:hypothetical protein